MKANKQIIHKKGSHQCRTRTRPKHQSHIDRTLLTLFYQYQLGLTRLETLLYLVLAVFIIIECHLKSALSQGHYSNTAESPVTSFVCDTITQHNNVQH